MKSFKNIKSLSIFLVSLSFIVFGCEKINLFSAPKTPSLQKPQQVEPVKILGPLVAKINNLSLTLEELNDEVTSYNTEIDNSDLVSKEDKARLKITTREQKIDYLKNQMVRRILLYQEALKRGIDKNPDIVKALEKTKEDLLVVEIVREEAGKVAATSAEIEGFYNTNKDQLKEPEKRQIREIVVATEPEARDVLVQLLQGADFSTLAKERSKSASAKDGGDLGWIEKDNNKNPAQFNAVAFSDTLEVGKISSIFKVGDDYYVIKLEKKVGGKQKTLSELRDDIERLITVSNQQKRIDDLVGKLSQNAKIEINEGEIR